MRRSLSLTLQLLLTMVGLAVGAAVALGLLSYRSAIADLERAARRAVGIAAQGHEETLVRLLTLRQERAVGFLTSVTSSCGETAPSGRIGWEQQCVRTALSEFRTTEHADAAILLYRERTIARSGGWTPEPVPAPPALARIIRREGASPVYTMQASAEGLTLTLRFASDDLNHIFRNSYGLGAGGEVFLIDGEGKPITPVRYANLGAASLLQTEPDAVRQCLAGQSGTVVAADYRGAATIHAFRPVTLVGNGCIDAHFAYDEALAPAMLLRQQILFRSTSFLVIAILLSFIASYWIATPIRHLAASARAIQAGRFDRPVRISGPTEVRELSRAFAAMGEAIKDLLAREHDARVQAEDASQAKDDFLAMVSHELRTPLTAILGWTGILQTGKLDPEQAARAVQAIDRSAESQAKLIEDLLDVSRIVAGKLRLDRRDVALSVVVDGAMESVRPQLEAKAIDFHMNIDPSIGPVSADPQRLEQIVWNLLSNAVKFTPAGGRIDLNASCRDDEIELSVCDTGIGIKRDMLPHAFDRFWQADATSRVHGGLGLGLAIVRHLVELHGGHVRAESDGEGRGATFVVTLPAADVHEAFGSTDTPGHAVAGTS